MWFDGIRFRKVRHLGWRMGDPERDVDDYGEPVSPHYVTIVKIKDCPIEIDERGRRVYNPSSAPQHVALAHSRTNMGYGKEHKRLGRLCTPVYLVHDGYVYMGTLHREAA